MCPAPDSLAIPGCLTYGKGSGCRIGSRALSFQRLVAHKALDPWAVSGETFGCNRMKFREDAARSLICGFCQMTDFCLAKVSSYGAYAISPPNGALNLGRQIETKLHSVR